MAKGDTKHSRISRGGSGSYNYYDDEGRGDSAYFWDEFEGLFERSGYDKDWLMGVHTQGVDPTLARLFTSSTVQRWITGEEKSLLDSGLYDSRLWTYVKNMRDRYNVHDWAWERFDDTPDNDGRMRRLIVKKLGLETWREFQARAQKVWTELDEKKKTLQAEQADKNAQAQAEYEAERIERREKEVIVVKKDSDLVAGAIRADFESAFQGAEIYGRDEGEWLDDPVAAASTGYGFGEEVRKKSGIKLQVTVSLDQSNSMHNNGLHEEAAKSFRDIYLALEALKEEHPDDLYISAFTFSNDGYQAAYRGKRAENLTIPYSWKTDHTRVKVSTAESLGAVERYRDPSYTGHFDGEDTWFYPLFEQIEKWEESDSVSGAVKLDIIITDAVIEHPSDIRKSDVIQARRNGNLQTVMLNFLSEGEWVDSDLPLNCVQYPANKDNIAGMLRNLLTEFVSVYL